MKVLLLNPPSVSAYAVFGLSLPPMGLLYVAATLEQAGHEVVVRDMVVNGGSVSEAELKHADIIGISSDTTRIEYAMELARRASRCNRRVVLGGPHAQFLPKDVLKSGCVSAVVRGEGEAVFPDLLSAIESGDELQSVRGIIFSSGNQIISTPDADPVDVESLPLPARHLVDLNLYGARLHGRPLTPLVTSRGCPSSCHFCSSSSFFGRGWRSRSAESVLAELDEIYNHYGFRAVAFTDDNFTLQPERVEHIASGVLERGYDLKWWNFSRVDTIVRHPEMVSKMAAAGSTTVYLGIESGNNDTLNSLGKNTTSSDIVKAVDILRQNRIEAYGSYIIGNLNEDAADIDETMDLAVRLDTNIAQFSILTPYPGTKLYEELKDRITCRRWKFFDGLHLVFQHPKLSVFRMQSLLVKAYVKFYRRSGSSIGGFKKTMSSPLVSFKKIISCIWEVVFEFHLGPNR